MNKPILITGISIVTIVTGYFYINTVEQSDAVAIDEADQISQHHQSNDISLEINSELLLDQPINNIAENSQVVGFDIDNATDSFKSIYAAMVNKSISEEEIEKKFLQIAETLNDNPQKQEEMSTLFQSLPADSLEKFFLQEMLMESNGGNQVLKQQVQHILDYNETENFMHLVEIAHFLGHQYLGQDISMALNNKMLDTLSHTQSIQDSPALFYHAIASIDRDAMMSPIDTSEVIHLLEDIFISANNDHVAVKSVTARKIMMLGDVEDQVEFALSALDNDEIEIVETVLLSLNHNDLYEDHELKSKITYLSTDPNLPISTRMKAINRLQNSFQLDENEKDTLDRELSYLNHFL